MATTAKAKALRSAKAGDSSNLLTGMRQRTAKHTTEAAASHRGPAIIHTHDKKKMANHSAGSFVDENEDAMQQENLLANHRNIMAANGTQANSDA